MVVCLQNYEKKTDIHHEYRSFFLSDKCVLTASNVFRDFLRMTKTMITTHTKGSRTLYVIENY